MARFIGVLGFGLATLSGWVLVNSLRLVESLAEQPLIVAGLGPGPIVSLAGALLALMTMILPSTRQLETAEVTLSREGG